LSLREPAFCRRIKRPQTALINPMEESVINCSVRQVRQIRLVFAVRLTTLLLLAGGGVMSLAAQSSGQEQALKVNVSSADARYTIAMPGSDSYALRALLVAFLSSDEKVGRYERDLLQELKKKRLVKTQIAVGGHSGLPLDGLADRYLSPDIRTAVPDDCRPPVDVLFGQLLGLFFSLRCNLMPDHPSPDGVISRVVQNVKTYA